MEGRVYVNIVYDTFNNVEVPKVGLKPFSKNVSKWKWLIDAICFRYAVPDLGDKG